ncbi:DUF3347 domain-containing protein [soil metagenome]
MTNLIILLAMGSSLSLQSCKHSDSSTSNMVEHHSHSVIDNKTEHTDNSSVDSSKFSAVYNNYLGIKNALSKDQNDSASFYAGQLLNMIEVMNTTHLTAEQLSVWNKNKSKIKDATLRIKESTGIESQRDQFISLSLSFHTIILSFKDNSAPVYYQFCPMANDGKGAYWISEQSKISNPYYGKKMISCGSTKETINENK